MTENKQKDKKEIFFSENTGKTFAVGGIVFIILAAIVFRWDNGYSTDVEVLDYHK